MKILKVDKFFYNFISKEFYNIKILKVIQLFLQNLFQKKFKMLVIEI